MSVATPSAPPGDGLDVADWTSRLSLFEKLSHVQQDYLAGKLAYLSVPDKVSHTLAQGALGGSEEDATSSLPGISGAYAPADALPGLSTHQSPAHSLLNSQSELQRPVNGGPASTPDDELEDGEVQQTGTPLSDLAPAQRTDVMVRPEESLGLAPLARSQGLWQSSKELHISEPRDYPYVDLAPVVAQAQALVPPVLRLAPERNKSFSTESLYSSRGTWSAKGSPQQLVEPSSLAMVADEVAEPTAMEITSNEDSAEGQVAEIAPLPPLDDNDYSPSNERVGYAQFPATPPYATELSVPRKGAHLSKTFLPRAMVSQVPDAVEIPSDDDWAVAMQASDTRKDYGGLNGLNEDSTSSRGDLIRLEEDDYDPETEEDYEPPGAGAFDSGGRRTARNLPPFIPYPGKAKVQQIRAPTKANKQQMAAGNRQAIPQQQRGKQPAKKRRRLEYPADPRKRVQHQVALESPLSQYYTEPSSSESFIKQEPLSPPPLLPPERIPLPETPPTFSRRQSGYGSDVNGYGSGDRYHDRSGHAAPQEPVQVPTASSRPRNHDPLPVMSSAFAPYNPSQKEPDPRVTIPRPEETAADPLKIVAIGRNSGKLFYNRPVRPGDVIPQPDANVQYIDDPTMNAPPAPTVQQRSISSYPEPRNNPSYQERPHNEAPPLYPEQRLPSHHPAARAYTAYPEAAAPRAYSHHPGDQIRPSYQPPPHSQDAYRRPELSTRGYDSFSGRDFAPHADHGPIVEPVPEYPRRYESRTDHAAPGTTNVLASRAYSMRPDYPAPVPAHMAYERAPTGRPESGHVAAASEYDRASEYWARPSVPQRAHEETYPPNSRGSAPYHRSQSVHPAPAYKPAAPVRMLSPPYAAPASKALMPPPPVPAYGREYHQPRHASAAPWQ